MIASGTEENTPKPVKEITATNQTEFTYACWGPLNKTIFVGTKSGRVMIIDAASGVTIRDMQIHTEEIY